MHNLRFIIRLTEQARQAILDGTFKEFKESFLNHIMGTNNCSFFMKKEKSNDFSQIVDKSLYLFVRT